MAEDDQEKPLTPGANFPRSPSVTVDEALSIELDKRRHRFHRRTVCCGITAAVFLIIAVVVLVLAFTVLHVKNPKITMNSVAITGLDQVSSLGTANLTVVADVSVKNPNVAAFRFSNSTASLLYRGTVVAVADVAGGLAKARRTMRMNLTFDVTVAEVVGNPQLGSDLAAGILPVTSFTSVRGKVKILKIIRRKVTVRMNCTMAVNITSREIIGQDCKRHVSISL